MQESKNAESNAIENEEKLDLSDLKDLSHTIVQEAIKEATSIFVDEQFQKINTIEVDDICDKDTEIPNIEWPACANFTPEVGIEKIKEFITTWDRDASWLHHVDCIATVDNKYDVTHNFRVRWSQPTKLVPIPRAIACVYFTVVVSKVTPKIWPVKVTYVFESNRLKHVPGKSKFREVWLENIIKSKMAVLQNVTF